ncbi:uncharacterized protein LOC115663807 isoform X1 [Syzygium oleosum]|uniref:uncharacterized protein LOC115663807 isoform X1 n=1 Tax=Syzygium oleosum TaxID=219896 RepID=UPI0024B94C3F|nr:uncharacterized protein LOC115663807 isoform X1 [Syzygium oleosum]
MRVRCFSCSEESKTSLPTWESSANSDVQDSLGLGLDEQKVQAFAASKFGARELRSLIFKGGGLITLAKISQLIARRLSGKVLLEAANYQIRKEVVKKGGQLAAINLVSRAALLAAKKVMTFEFADTLESYHSATTHGHLLHRYFIKSELIIMFLRDWFWQILARHVAIEILLSTGKREFMYRLLTVLVVLHRLFGKSWFLPLTINHRRLCV